MANYRRLLENSVAAGTNDLEARPNNLTQQEQEMVDDTVKDIMPVIVADEISAQDTPDQEKIFVESMSELDAFLKGNGLLTEAYNPANTKNNLIRKSADAASKRMRTIFVLKLAQENDDKEYKAYKSGDRVKRKALQKLYKKYGNRAEAMANEAHKKIGVGRIRSVIDNNTTKIKNRKSL